MQDFAKDHLKDISKIIQENLLAFMKNVGKVAVPAIISSLIMAILGLILCLLLYYLYNQMGSFSQSETVSSVFFILLLIYLILAGIIIGAILGFVFGIKKGLKRTLIENKYVEKIINTVVISAINQSYKVKDKTGSLAKNINTHLISWKQNLNIRVDNLSSKSTLFSLLFKFKEISQNLIVNKITDSFKSVSGEISNLDIDTSNKEELINQIANLCQRKTDSLIGISIDQIFRKPLLSTYILTLIIFVLPFIFLLIF